MVLVVPLKVAIVFVGFANHLVIYVDSIRGISSMISVVVRLIVGDLYLGVVVISVSQIHQVKALIIYGSLVYHGDEEVNHFDHVIRGGIIPEVAFFTRKRGGSVLVVWSVVTEDCIYDYLVFICINDNGN